MTQGLFLLSQYADDYVNFLFLCKELKLSFVSSHFDPKTAVFLSLNGHALSGLLDKKIKYSPLAQNTYLSQTKGHKGFKEK